MNPQVLGQLLTINRNETMEIKSLTKGIALAGLLAFTGNSMAVTAPGALGANSTGTVDIDVQVGDLVRITNLVAMTGNTYTPGGDVTDSTPACVYRNGSPTYQIRAFSGQGAGNSEFLLEDVGTTGIYVEYTVDFDDGSTSSTLVYNTLTPFTNANQTDDTCAGGTANNATITVNILEFGVSGFNGLAEVPAGTYFDELSIEVSPI